MEGAVSRKLSHTHMHARMHARHTHSTRKGGGRKGPLVEGADPLSSENSPAWLCARQDTSPFETQALGSRACWLEIPIGSPGPQLADCRSEDLSVSIVLQASSLWWTSLSLSVYTCYWFSFSGDPWLRIQVPCEIDSAGILSRKRWVWLFGSPSKRTKIKM